MANKHWQIKGAYRDSGQDANLHLAAESAEEATSIARGMGILIERVEPAPPRLATRAKSRNIAPLLIILFMLAVAGAITFVLSKGGTLTGGPKAAPSADPLFVEAVRSSSIEDVKFCLGREMQVNTVDPNGIPLICLAVENPIDSESKQILEMLLARGASVEMKDRFGQTPLFYAARSGNNDAVRLLLKQGARVDVADGLGENPLHAAIELDHAEALRLLIAAGGSAGKPDAEGSTPLHRAAADGSIASIRVLLASGVDVNALDAKGYTPLHRADLAFRDEAAALLKQAGGKP